MKIVSRRQAPRLPKPAAKAWRYPLDQYELQYHDRFTKTQQTWHHHQRVTETLFIVEGSLTLLWRRAGRLHRRVIRAGDLIETGTDPHTFTVRGHTPAKLVVIRQVLSRGSKRYTLRHDTVYE